MSRPHRNPKSGVYFFRQKVPADLRDAFGKTEVGWSLRTKDPEEAKLRHADAARQQALRWAALRSRPGPVPHRQLVALAGVYYRELDALLQDEPGEESLWVTMLAKFDVKDPGADRVTNWFGEDADRLLTDAGISADAYSRDRLCRELHRVWLQWSALQLKRSRGDYGPDADKDRFPPLQEAFAPAVTLRSALTLGDLYKLWERDHFAAGKPKKTADDYRQKIQALAGFLGDDSAEAVSGANISDFCDHLVHEKGLKPKTLKDKYLAAIKAIYAVGVGKRKLPNNPAERVKVRVPKRTITRPRGFTDAEAKQILRCALQPLELRGKMAAGNALAIRWAPWICAYSGARVTEITQLRREDLLKEYGIWFLRITPDAGSVKTGHYRLVPLHPHLIEMGLPDFIEGRPDGPLFYSASEEPETNLARSRNAGEKVADWVRTTAGIDDPKVWPNHGWRHRFKTVARDVDIPPEYSDVITGHDDRRASSDYGETTIKALWREIQKLPRYEV